MREMSHKQIDEELTAIYSTIQNEKKEFKENVRGRSLREVITLVCEWRNLCLNYK